MADSISKYRAYFIGSLPQKEALSSSQWLKLQSYLIIFAFILLNDSL